MIPGVGQKRKKALLKHLGDLPSIERAEAKELQNVPGIDHKIAKNIFTHFHRKHS